MPGPEPRTGSGKQILLRILSDLALRVLPADQLAEATRRLRAGLLLRGSTSDDSFEQVRRLAWISDHAADGHLIRSGTGTAASGVLISDVVETLREMPGMIEYVRAQHPGLSIEDVDACLWAIWMIVSSAQMFTELTSVETGEGGEIDLDRWIDNYTAKYRYFFRDDPDT